MREYLTTVNFTRALALGTVVTAMALPRLAQAGGYAGWRAGGCLVTMTLAAGAVTAWGAKAGLRGPYRGAGETARGCGVALLLALLLSPAQHWIVQPLVADAVRSSADAQWIRLQIPASAHDWLALVLWSAGFQTLFCVAAPTCFAARLTERVWPAIVLTMVFSGYVALRQLDLYHVECGRGLLVAVPAAKSFLGFLVYVRFGLAPSSVLFAGLNLHLLWNVP